MDELIEYINKFHGDMYYLQYSTPGAYIDAVKKKNVKWPTKYDDMFPYEDRADSYWTGYFTSKVNDKQLIRRFSSNLHSSCNLYSHKVLDQTTKDGQIKEIIELKDNLLNKIGIVQHHDAVTGTERTHVADAYKKNLTEGMWENNQLYGQLLGEHVTLLDNDLKDKFWS